MESRCKRLWDCFTVHVQHYLAKFLPYLLLPLRDKNLLMYVFSELSLFIVKFKVNSCESCDFQKVMRFWIRIPCIVFYFEICISFPVWGDLIYVCGVTELRAGTLKIDLVFFWFSFFDAAPAKTKGGVSQYHTSTFFFWMCTVKGNKNEAISNYSYEMTTFCYSLMKSNWLSVNSAQSNAFRIGTVLYKTTIKRQRNSSASESGSLRFFLQPFANVTRSVVAVFRGDEGSTHDCAFAHVQLSSPRTSPHWRRVCVGHIPLCSYSCGSHYRQKKREFLTTGPVNSVVTFDCDERNTHIYLKLLQTSVNINLLTWESVLKQTRLVWKVSMLECWSTRQGLRAENRPTVGKRDCCSCFKEPVFPLFKSIETPAREDRVVLPPFVYFCRHA